MIGKTISHYRILEKLGEGGMGVVYKAQDTKLDRIVALKFLPKHLLRDEEAKKRFVHEAKAASALNHINITTIYEIDEAEGECFISMEYVEGKSLKELIKGGQIQDWEIGKAVDVAIQIAEGLSKAHQKGIVHRDVKSDNIMFTSEDLVKIMDFGLAKLKGVTGLTKTGTTLGTIQYMSPEQAQGMDVDQRSDIFSFGVVLYEMITGQLPFKGEHEAAVIYSIVNETPEPLARYKSNVPERLQRIIDKTLEKDRNIRYQSAAEIIADLKGLQKETTAGVVARPKKRLLPFIIPTSIVSIIVLLVLILKPFKVEVVPEKKAIAKENSLAVMYFENMVDEGDQLLGDMITNLLITDLAESEYIQVVSYQRLYDILRILGKEGSRKIDRSVATEVAKKAGVNNMLLGSISQLGDKKILTSRLVDVSSGTVKKSQKVQGTDIHAMVDQLTREVKNDLSLPEEAMAEKDKPVAELSTKSEDAYRHYLRGLDYENRLFYKEALEQYKKALEFDSTFAGVHLQMWSTYRWLGSYDLAKQAWGKAIRDSAKTPQKDRMWIRAGDFWESGDLVKMVKAEEPYREIISRYPDEKGAYLELGDIQLYILANCSAAIPFYEKALELDPHFGRAVSGLGYAHLWLENYEQAKILFEKDVSLRPNDPVPHIHLGELYEEQKEYDRALKEYQIALELKPDFIIAYKVIGIIYLKKKEYEKARANFKKMGATGGLVEKAGGLRYLARSYFAEGRFEEGFKCLGEKLEIQKKTGPRAHAWGLNETGWYCLQFEKYDSALECFEEVKSFAPDHYRPSDIAEIYLIKKNFKKAQEITDAHEKGLGFEGHPDPIAASQNYLRGIVEREKGNYKEAAKYLQKTVEVAGVWAGDYRFDLARVCLLDENFSKAEEEFVKIIEDPSPSIDYIKSLYYLAKVKEGLKQKKEAMKYYEEFLDYWGNADWELPEIKDAKERLEKLKAES